MGRTYSTKEKLGALIYDCPRLLFAVSNRRGWVRMRNRSDAVSWPEDRSGIACNWEYTRTLHVADVFPDAGRALMRRALVEWPIRLQSQPDNIDALKCCSNSRSDPNDLVPDVSILIGHRGRERGPLLQAVLQSLAAQSRVRFEVVVVEQDTEPLVKEEIPDWVRYIHTPCPPDRPYCRSWAFNVAAREARAPLLILHDNDMLAPAEYAAESLRRFRQGWEVMNLKRFIFYIAESRNDIGSILAGWAGVQLQSVVQNLEGGGSVAIGASAYHEIGGFDEAFVGWGGEDNEFWDRCLTRKVWEYTYLPIVHLWHPPQPGKCATGGMGVDTAELTRGRRAIPANERIQTLHAQQTSRTGTGRQGNREWSRGSAVMPESPPANRHRDEFLSRGYQHCEQIHSQHNARWKTYWNLERNDGVQCFAKVNYGYEDTTINVIMGRKEALLSEYFQQFVNQPSGWQVPQVLDHWESACGYFVVYEWLELQSLPLVSILESSKMTGLLADLLVMLDGVPPPPFWSKDMVIHDFGCSACYPAEGCEMAPFGFDLDDNISFSESSDTFVMHDFEFIQWAARGLQGTYITLKCLHEFRKHLALVLRSGSAVRRLAETVPSSCRQARLPQAIEAFAGTLERNGRWTVVARLRLGLSRWIAERLP